MIVKVASLQTADKVLEALTKLMSDSEKEEGYVEVFPNCREQGYVVRCLDVNYDNRFVIFAENRNSDHIVVYKGTGHCLNVNNMPLNSLEGAMVWNSRKFFDYNEADKAAQYCLDYLRFPVAKKEKAAVCD